MTRLLYSTREAAQMLSISERQVWQLAHDGRLKALKIGRSVRFAHEDLSAFVEQLRDEETTQTPARVIAGAIGVRVHEPAGKNSNVNQNQILKTNERIEK